MLKLKKIDFTVKRILFFVRLLYWYLLGFLFDERNYKHFIDYLYDKYKVKHLQSKQEAAF